MVGNQMQRSHRVYRSALNAWRPPVGRRRSAAAAAAAPRPCAPPPPLRDDRRHRRVGVALGQVAGRGPLEVPPRRHVDERHEDQHRQRHDRGHEEGRCRGEHRRHEGDQRLGHREADGAREGVDVAGRTRQQVTSAGALDRAERKCEHLRQELLAQVGQHLLAEHRTRPCGRSASAPSGRARTRRAGARRRRRGRGRRPVLDPLHQAAQQPRTGEAGHGRDRVQRQCPPELARVPAHQGTGVGARLCAGRHGQGAPHSSSPRVTTAR
jgi:hypothetical protein